MRLRAILLAVLVLVASAVCSVIWSSREDAWEARAKSALVYANQQKARADSADQRAKDLAVQANERERRIRPRVAAARRVVAPDTCAPFIAVRDSIIDELTISNADWRAAYEQSQLSRDGLTQAVDSLTRVLSSRPRPKSRLLPEFGVGVFAGACTSGPCFGAGVTLAWKVGRR